MLTNRGNVDGWYQDAEKVPWSPPNWLFGPTWTVLYLLIAVAGFLIWRRGFRGTGQRNAHSGLLALYAVQLTLNALWSPMFFAGYPLLGSPALWVALIIILALDVLVALLIARARRSVPLAAALLVPYLLWILFATTLNAGIAVLN